MSCAPNYPLSQLSTHLAVVTETWPPEINGVAHTISQLVKQLQARKDYRITLIRPRQSQAETALRTENFQELLVSGFRLPFYQQVRLGYPHYLGLKRAWQATRPDLVQIVTEGPLGYAALKAAHSLGIPVISDFHTHFDQYSHYYRLAKLNSLAERYLRSLHNQTLLTLVPTQELRRQLIAQGYQSLAVVERGIDKMLFNPQRRSHALREHLGIRPKQLLVTLVSRLAQEKNLDLAFTTFRAIQNAIPDARFLVVGDGPDRARLQALHPDCLFVGMQTKEALAAHYASGDLFIYPSTSETFGNVVIEAMASGLPVVAFDYAAAHQHIRHQENGCCVALHDSTAFIQTAVQLALDPALRQYLGQQAHLSTQNLSWQQVANSLHQTIQTLLQELKHETASSIECA